MRVEEQMRARGRASKAKRRGKTLPDTQGWDPTSWVRTEDMIEVSWPLTNLVTPGCWLEGRCERI